MNATATQKGRFDSYTFNEGRTGKGQLVKFSCPNGETDQVKNFLAAQKK